MRQLFAKAFAGRIFAWGVETSDTTGNVKARGLGTMQNVVKASASIDNVQGQEQCRTPGVVKMVAGKAIM